MAGLDVAAGVVGIASAGMIVAKGLIQIADGIGSAGEEVRLCASDTALFSRMLENLGDALSMPTAASRATQRTTEDLVEVSERILQPFQNLIDRLTPLLKKYRESEDHLLQLGLRIQWYFRHRSKVTLYQHALGQIKSTLNCLLGSMNLQEARANASQQVFVYQMEAENSRASLNRGIRRQHAALSSPDTANFLSALDPTKSKLKAIEHGSEPEIREVDAADITQIVDRKDLDHVDLKNIDNDIDDDVTQETAVALHIDMLSLQRKVMKIATNVLTQNEMNQKVTPMKKPSDLPRKPFAKTRMEQSGSTRDFRTKTIMKHPDSPVSGFSGPSSDQSVKIKGETRLNLAPQDQTQSSSVASGFKDLREEYKVALLDERGVKHEFSFHRVQRYKNFKRFFRSDICASKDRNDPRFFRNIRLARRLKPYFVTDQNGIRILPSTWEESVMPGMTLMVSFEDMSLNSSARNDWLVEHSFRDTRLETPSNGKSVIQEGYKTINPSFVNSVSRKTSKMPSERGIVIEEHRNDNPSFRSTLGRMYTRGINALSAPKITEEDGYISSSYASTLYSSGDTVSMYSDSSASIRPSLRI